MSWILYLFGSGQALFLGAGMVLAAVALLPRVGAGWKAATLAMVARLGLFLAILSAVPLSYWLYAMAISITVVWLWRERKRGRESLPSKDPSSSLQGLVSAKTPDPIWLRRATALIWLGIIALELPHQFAPRLPPLESPALWIIGDSVTAGVGSNETNWPDLLPENVETHNLARVGATAAMAVKSQANQLPVEGGLVLIEIGGNDLLGDTTSAQFERDLDQLLSQLRAPRRTLVMFELPLPPLCNEYGRIQRRLAARHGVRLIPKRTLISVLAGGGATLDSIHLSEAGHQRMADEVWSVIGPAYR
jgi:acyl-CoA thioesterase I